MSVVEMAFALPAARDLWDACDAEEWKARYLAKRTKNSSFTVIDGMYNTSHLASELDNIDMGLGSLAILYGFWCPVWAYNDARATTYLSNTAGVGSSASHWAGARRQELYQTIQTTSLKLRSLNSICPEGQLVSEFLMMSLHAAFEDMQRFAGRYGVDEFKQVLPRLQEWAQSDDQYAAAWHAGQVLRVARSFAPTHLRGFPAVAVYQACLTLFVFTVFSKLSLGHAPDNPVSNRTTEVMTGYGTRHTPLVAQGQSAQATTYTTDGCNTSPEILLDGDETMDVRTYLRTGHGRPRLMVSGQARDLENPVVIGTVMAETFRSNYPSKSDPLPPLLDSLANLMGDICKTFVAE